MPIDVRVLDETGQAVTGLTAADFEIREDGREQAIAHFTTIDYTAQIELQGQGARFVDEPSSITASSRTFLVLLGRGRLNGPARGLEGAVDFIRSGLRPNDYVGVVAYDRVTDIVRDRGPILRLLQVYRERHELIEAELDLFYGGLAGRFAAPRLDATPLRGIQREIDTLFEEPGLPPLRHLAAVAEADRLDLPTGQSDVPVEALSAPGELISDASARDDLLKLYASLNYLRTFQGEKHLIYVSEDGLLFLERSDISDGFAAMAADARVTVSAIHTGGLAARFDGGVYTFPWEHRWAVQDSKSMATMTGGVASAYRYASEAFERLSRAMRTAYVLGYYPPDRRNDGRFRRIQVTVKRPGLAVLHRHGYYDRIMPPPGDRRRVMVQARIATAAASRLPLRDLAVSVQGSYISRGAGTWRIRAEVVIDPANVRFVAVDGRQVAQLDVAVFAGNAGDELVGEAWERVDLNLDATTFQRLRRESIAVGLTLDLKAAGGRLKAVVHDYLGDRIGTATREIR